MKQLNQKILQCEIEYYKCFSKYYENEEIIRFRDNELPDMYYHNYTYIKKVMKETKLRCIIENEISLRLLESSDFCNIILNGIVNDSLLSSLEYTPQLSKISYYSFDISNFKNLNNLDGCTVKKVVNQEMIEDILFCDLEHDEKKLGKNFCTRRCYRRGRVYTSDKGVDSYVCYHNGNIIGSCDLFIHNGVAKIEDFAVIPKYQRKGYGTSILKALIGTSIKENCHTIYLVTDENDTPKEMYEKIEFYKVGERTELFFKL